LATNRFKQKASSPDGVFCFLGVHMAMVLPISGNPTVKAKLCGGL
jgi:hypothetical protein